MGLITEFKRIVKDTAFTEYVYTKREHHILPRYSKTKGNLKNACKKNSNGRHVRGLFKSLLG